MLSIGVSVGSLISVGDHILRVKSIAAPNVFVIDVDGANEVVISEHKTVMILPGVKVQAGLGKKGGSNRLAFEAPRSIRISRIEDSPRRKAHENRRESTASSTG